MEKEIKLCKNCKHFKRNNDNIHSTKYGECNCNKFVYGTSFEHSNSKYNDFSNKADELLYQDYENYSANFEVGENFGCIHWEE